MRKTRQYWEEVYERRSKFVRKCKCGHSIDYHNNKPFLICTWCGNRIYKSDELEFKYELMRRIGHVDNVGIYKN